MRHDSACSTTHFVVNNSEIETLSVVELLPGRNYEELILMNHKM